MLKTAILTATSTALLMGAASYKLYERQSAALALAQGQVTAMVQSSTAVVGACHTLEATIAQVTAHPVQSTTYATESDYGKALAAEAESVARQKLAAAKRAVPQS